MTQSTGGILREHYRELYRAHGDGPTATQMSREGKLFRYRKLFEIGDLNGATVLDVGCGLGEMYPELAGRFPAAGYHGADLVPELIAAASLRYPGVSFRVLDMATALIEERFDYVLMSALFNNAMDQPTEYLEQLVEQAWAVADRGIGFNFLPTHVNFVEPTMAYHDPGRVLDFCLRRLSFKVRLEHHYQRCDVAVFVYK